MNIPLAIISFFLMTGHSPVFGAPFVDHPGTSDCYEETFCIDSETIDERVDIFVRSLVSWEITMILDVAAENMRANAQLPLTESYKGLSRTKVVSLAIDDPDVGWEFSFSVKWIQGDFKAEHQRGFAYELPYSKGEEYLVGQGYLGNLTHQGKYAIDWDMPSGTYVRAARAGIVIDLVEEFTEGRPDPELKSRANYVKIRHSDGTIGNYVHLAPRSVSVNIGAAVSTGQVIARSGNTGFTSGPHLHFEVYSATRDLGRRTIPVEFNTARRGAIQLKEGAFYSR
ncbi:MAG: M23 family metallopeptidase [Bacteroidetes bacterium]|nr:M23 family metallopeptidase [Bacteroidota bacterium]